MSPQPNVILKIFPCCTPGLLGPSQGGIQCLRKHFRLLHRKRDSCSPYQCLRHKNICRGVVTVLPYWLIRKEKCLFRPVISQSFSKLNLLFSYYKRKFNKGNVPCCFNDSVSSSSKVEQIAIGAVCIKRNKIVSETTCCVIVAYLLPF